VVSGVKLLYAHRGAPAELPENTLPSFRRALDVGANALETDAHLTRDGHVVLSHDPTGARACGVHRDIRACSLAEVRAWDAGIGWSDARGERPFVGKGFRVPLLEELLREFPRVPINVDAKLHRPEIVAPLIDVIRRCDAEDRVTIASFDVRTLRRIRAAGYRGRTGLAQAEVLVLLTPLARVFRPKGNVAQLPDRMRGVTLGTRAVIDRCHALGLDVHYWTIDSPQRARALLEMGADGIMTDDPRRVAEAFR
jgi:glycerophosphoryl diester phosphodiesterase